MSVAAVEVKETEKKTMQTNTPETLAGETLAVPEETQTLKLDDIYTPLEVAKEEIWRRWNDKELRAKVEEFLGGDVPEIFKDGPKSALVRHVISANQEVFSFLERQKNLGIDYVLAEYPKDIFVSYNLDKYYLGKMSFFNSRENHNLSKVVIDFNKSNGAVLDGIQTLWGEHLVDFHHKALSHFKGINPEDIFNISSFFKKHGGKSELYYPYYLSLFICFGVLFEFLLIDSRKEKEFVDDTLLPTVNKLNELFGVKPLIVKIFDDSSSRDALNWMRYPKELYGDVPVNQVGSYPRKRC